MKFANHRWHHMRLLQVKVIIWTIEIGWHTGNILCSILTIIALTKFDASNFCKCISIIRRLKKSCKKVLFFDWLWCKFWIDTTWTKKKKFFYSTLVCWFNNIHLNPKIILKKIHWIGIISDYSSDFCGCKKDVFWLFSLKKILNRISIQQIQLRMCTKNNIWESFFFKISHKGWANKSTMTSNIDFWSFFHKKILQLDCIEFLIFVTQKNSRIISGVPEYKDSYPYHLYQTDMVGIIETLFLDQEKVYVLEMAE